MTNVGTKNDDVSKAIDVNTPSDKGKTTTTLSSSFWFDLTKLKRQQDDNDKFTCIESMESSADQQQEKRPVDVIKLNYSVENGLEEQDPMKHQGLDDGDERKNQKKKKLSRREICIVVVGFVGFLGCVLLVATAALSLKSSSSSNNEEADDGTNSLLSVQKQNQLPPLSVVNPTARSGAGDVDRSRFSNDKNNNSNNRGEGGGAGNNKAHTNNLPIDDDVDFDGDNMAVSSSLVVPPFSVLDPVKDLGRYGYDRPENSKPKKRLDPLKRTALPTNAWYQNMLRLDDNKDPTKDHRMYTIPYMMDAAGSFPGLRAHGTRLESTPTQVQIQIDEPYGLTLGCASTGTAESDTTLDKGYTVHEATELGLTLHWMDSYMKSNIVRGSPYLTMVYDTSHPMMAVQGILPTMRFEMDTAELPLIDGRSRSVDCKTEPVFVIQNDIELKFLNSNQRWLIFFSRPVEIKCSNEQGRPTILQVLKNYNNDDGNQDDPLLVIRGALVFQSSDSKDNNDDEGLFFGERYARALRVHSNMYPGQATAVTHSFKNDNSRARISFHWDPQSMSGSSLRTIMDDIDNDVISRIGSDNNGDGEEEMIMFALPHHREVLSSSSNVMENLCTISLLGPVCLTKGNTWNMYENLPNIDFYAPRHPDPKLVPVLAEALLEDIHYKIPENFRNGAGDTYFSGKTIAKLARILLITEELKDLCDGKDWRYDEVCNNNLVLPSDDDIEIALDQLRDAVTVWVKTNTETPFVYDTAWGGYVSCGCLYNGGKCTNVFPACPAFTDQGLNFGNGFYNDHHFHYGYHVYGAAVLAHFDSSWAIKHHEDVLLLVRDYANPSSDDEAFPLFRNKDWYRGHSYASGITEPMFRDVMNQESSSEAIASYEAIALYGKVMTSIFRDIGDETKASVAKSIHRIGLTLTITEIRSTQRYWQIRRDDDADGNDSDSMSIFPATYKNRVVGIMWETFAQFTTWFGNAPYLIYGIQLLPLTPISEVRDNLNWSKEIYEPLNASCNALCVSEGWSVQIYALLATIGRKDEAIDKTLNLSSDVYEHAGGNGHSKSNLIWYISTRPDPNRSNNNKNKDDSFEIGYNTDSSSNHNADNDDASSSTDEIEDENEEDIDSNEDDPYFDDDNASTDELVHNDDNNRNEDYNNDASNEVDDDDYYYYYYDSGSRDDKLYDDNDTANNGGSSRFRNKGRGSSSSNDKRAKGDIVKKKGLTCYNPNSCTDEILNTIVEGHSCGNRIHYVMEVLGKTETEACRQVAVDEYPAECGSCQPP